MELIVNTLIWSAVFQGLLLGLIFIFSKKHRSFSNTLLGLFMITFIFGAINDLLPFDSIGNYLIGPYFSLPEVKIIFPVLFLHFVLEKLGRSASYRKFLISQYIIAFAVAGITLINIFFEVSSGKTLADSIDYTLVESIFMGQQYYAFLLTVTALTIAVRETLRYRDIARNEYSDLAMLSITWLWQFIFILVPVIVLWGAELVRIILGGQGQSGIVMSTWIFVAIFSYFVSYKAFSRQDLFYASVDNTPGDDAAPERQSPGEARQLSDSQVCLEIKATMEKKRYYLNQDLSIHDFAKAINISSRTISSCINQSFGVNFNEWVNNFRVERALELMKDQKSKNLSIEGIGSDSGFKSRSARYIAFKKKTGYTPGHFRNI